MKRKIRSVPKIEIKNIGEVVGGRHRYIINSVLVIITTFI